MEDFPVLCRTELLAGLSPEEVGQVLRCLGVKPQAFSAGETIWQEGQSVECIGVILSGRVRMIHDDVWGNRSLFGEREAGELFGEIYALSAPAPLPFSVCALEDSRILFPPAARLTHLCERACMPHRRLLENLLLTAARRTLTLDCQLKYMMCRTTREKLLSYLSDAAQREGRFSVTVPFSRQQLADYLAVDRSAMTRELSRMKREGLLDFEGRRFVLKGQSGAQPG